MPTIYELEDPVSGQIYEFESESEMTPDELDEAYRSTIDSGQGAGEDTMNRIGRGLANFGMQAAQGVTNVVEQGVKQPTKVMDFLLNLGKNVLPQEVADKLSAGQATAREAVDTIFESDNSYIDQFARDQRQLADEIYKTNPKFERENKLRTAVVEAVPSVVGALATAPLGGGISALTMGLQAGQSSKEEVLAAGATEEQADIKFGTVGAAAAITEKLFGTVSILNRAFGGTGKTVAEVARKAKVPPSRLIETLGAVATGFGKEGAQEAFEQIVDNATTMLLGYDENRKWNDGLWESALVGGILGGPLNAAVEISLNQATDTAVSRLKAIDTNAELNESQKAQQRESILGDLHPEMRKRVDVRYQIDPAVEALEATGSPLTAEALEQKAQEAVESKFAAAEEAIATTVTPPPLPVEIPGFDPNQPVFNSDDSPEVTEAKIAQVMETRADKTPEEQAAIDNLITEVRKGGLSLTGEQTSERTPEAASSAQPAPVEESLPNETTTPTEAEPVPEPAQPAPAAEPTSAPEPAAEATEAVVDSTAAAIPEQSAKARAMALKRREAQQRRLNDKLAETGTFSKYDAKVDKALKGRRKPLPAPDPEKISSFTQLLDRVTNDLNAQFIPEMADAVKSTALRFYTHELQSGRNPKPNVVLDNVRQDYWEKISTRPELQRQASLDAPIGESGATLGDVVAAEDDITPADRARGALANVVGKLTPEEGTAWATIAGKVSRDEALTEPEQTLWNKVRSAALEVYDTSDEVLRAAVGRGRIDTATLRRLQSGYYVPERIPERLRESGGRTDSSISLNEAEAVARGSHGAVRTSRGELEEYANLPEGPERDDRQFQAADLIRRAEEPALREWAQSTGNLLDEAAFSQAWDAQGQRGGMENQVYHDPATDRWFKRNNLIMNLHSGYLGFLHRIALHNDLFPGAALRFEGFMEHDGMLKPVISQANIPGIDATLPQIEAWMTRRGFTHIPGTNDYVKGDIKVGDLHAGNVVILADQNGNALLTEEGFPAITAIDPTVEMTLESKRDRLMEMALSGETLGASALAADMAEQAGWLRDQARGEGFDSLEGLVTANPERFMQLAQQWREEHPQTYAVNVYRNGPDPGPLITGLRDALAEVAPGIEMATAIDPDGAAIWTDGKAVMVDPAVLQTVLAEHPADMRESVMRKLIDEEVAHIAGLREISSQEAVELGSRMTSATVERVARQYVLRSRYDTDEAYEAALDNFRANPFRVAHEYLRMLSQRIRTGQTTEDIIMPQEVGAIATVNRYLKRAISWLRARLELAFDRDLSDMVNRLETARRGLAMRPQVMEDLGVTSEMLTPSTGFTAAEMEQLKAIPPSAPADFVTVGKVSVHKFVAKLAEQNPFYQKLIDAAQKFPGLKLGMGRDYAEYWAGDPYMVRIGSNLHELIGADDIPMVLRHEVIHALTSNLSGEAKVKSITEALTPEMRERVARAYLTASPRERTDEELEQDIATMAKNDFQVGYEYLRQVTEEILDGRLSENRLAELNENPTLFHRIKEYLEAFVANLRSFIRENPDDLAVREANRIAAFLQEDVPVLRAAAGTRLNTTSLHRVLSAVDPQTEQILAEKEYIADTISNTERAADEWIQLQGGIANVAQGDELLAQVDQSYLPPEQKQAVKAKIALKYKRLMEAIAAGPAVMDRAVLYDYLKRQHQRILIGLQEEGSRTGQLLSLFKGISKLFVPDTFRRQYVGKLTQQQATVAAKPGTREVAGALDAGRSAGAKAAVNRALKSLKKLMPADDPAQALFDFFADALSLRERGTIQGSGLPVRTEITNDVASRISAMLLRQGGVRKEEPLFNILNEKVRKAVQAQLVTKDEAPEITDEAALQGYLDKLVDRVMDTSLVEQAFNAAVQETLGETPQPMEARIARLQGLKFDQAKYLKATEFVTKALNFRELVTQTLEQQDSVLFNLLASLSESTGLVGDQARLLGEAIQSAYDVEAKRVARQRLEAIVRAKNPKIRITEPKIVKLLKLVNLGAFSEEKFYNAIAESYGLPTYNDEFADQVEQRGAEIQKMPESDAKNEAVRKLLSDIARERVKGYNVGQKVKYYLGDVAPAIWQAGILSGIPTHLVNYFSSQANVLLSATTDAAGYITAARKAGIKTVNTGDFMADVLIGWLRGSGILKNPAGNATLQEVQKAFATGTTRFRNEKGEEFSVLESEPLGVVHKYVGRLMVATDVVNQMSANEIKQRMALRYAWLQQGKTRKEIQEMMESAFNPAQDVLDQIDAQIEAESKWLGSKLDKARRRSELVEKRRFELLDGLDLISRDAAAKWTFNEEVPSGLMGYVVNKVIEPVNRATKISRFVFPFMRTLASIVNNTFDWSPIGIARGYNISATKLLGLEKYQRDFTPGSPEQYAQLTKAWAGTMAIAAIAGLMFKGLQDEEEGKEPFLAVYGEGPSDRNMNTQLEQGSSWQANTLKIGSARVRYTDFPVLSMFLGSLGKMSDLYRYEGYDDKNWTEIGTKGALAVASSLMEKNLLSGLSNMMDVINSDDNQKVSAFKRFTSGIVGGYTNPQLFKWARDTMGVNERGMVPVLDKTSSLEGWMMSLVPFSAGYNQAYLNALGEPIENLPWSATTRRFAVLDPTPQHPVFTPLVDAGLFVPAPSKDTKVGDVRVGSDPELWRRFVEIRGEELKKRLTPSRIEKLRAMDKEDAQDELNSDIGGAARDRAKKRLVAELKK